MSARLTVGDLAPDFTLRTSGGGTVRLHDYRGSSTVVYFYPAAMTAGCTAEACDFRDSLEPLREAGYEVVGISPDSVDKLDEFAEQEGLTFPLASDPKREVLAAWGVLGEKVKNGATVIGVIRSTVVVGPDGRVQHAMYDVKPVGHVAALRRELGVD